MNEREIDNPSSNIPGSKVFVVVLNVYDCGTTNRLAERPRKRDGECEVGGGRRSTKKNGLEFTQSRFKVFVILILF